jgi:site-specific DNA recombinase
MRAAIYARKSTEQSGLGDEARSVARQEAQARTFAARHGWVIAEDHVYRDDGISGAEFLKRPGFLRMMNALSPRPPFQVLIMSEESRLGRARIETEYNLKQIIDAGVRVFYYLDGREARLDDATSSFLESVRLYAAEVEREKGSQRTKDALLQRAKAGYVASGKVYGYDNVEVFSPPSLDGVGKRLHVVRRINQEQAATIRRIFELCASGKGLTRIAKTLNSEHVAPPRNDSKGWAPTAIREMLHRPLYRGEIVWNKTQKVTRRGTKKQQKRPESEWLRLDAPDLRIVPDELWQAAHVRLRQAHDCFARGTESGQLLGRPTRLDLESPYLLSGMAYCATCGGALTSRTRAHGTGRRRYYGCSYRQKRGATVCANAVEIPQEVLDDALMRAIAEALDERLLDEAVATALARLRSGQEQQLDRRTQIERELSLIEAQEHRLVEAVKRGDPIDPLVAALRAEENRKRALTAELANLADAARIAALDVKRVQQSLRARVADVRGLLGRRIPQTRQLLRKLLIGRLECEGFVEPGGKGYRFRGEATYAGLLTGAAATSNGGSNGIRTRVSALRGPCPGPG